MRCSLTPCELDMQRRDGSIRRDERSSRMKVWRRSEISAARVSEGDHPTLAGIVQLWQESGIWQWHFTSILFVLVFLLLLFMHCCYLILHIPLARLSIPNPVIPDFSIEIIALDLHLSTDPVGSAPTVVID